MAKKGEIMEQVIGWTYEHSLNSMSKVQRTKTGVFIRKINHLYKYRENGAKQMACVKFDGNKGRSIVPYKELVFIGERQKRGVLNG